MQHAYSAPGQWKETYAYTFVYILVLTEIKTEYSENQGKLK